MNTDTTPRKSHVRGLAAAIVAAARADRGLHPSSDVPGNYRVGREIIGTDGSMSGYGVAYPPKFAAADMPFVTTTRQLKRGFVILTETEAAEIAVAFVAEDGRAVERANDRLASRRERIESWKSSLSAEDYASELADAERHHAETLAKLATARTRYGKILAKSTPAWVAPPAWVETAKSTEQVAADAVAAAHTEEVTVPEITGTTVPVAQPLAEGELADLIRTKLATEDAHTAALAASAAAKVAADRTWRQAIVAASAAGLSHRAIAAAAGCTHPTVAKVLAEETAR